MDSTDAALIGSGIGLVGSVMGTFLANFVAEDYKRFHESRALAGGLAGELGSYADAWPLLHKRIDGFLEQLARGQAVKLLKIDQPIDRVFDGNVAKIGLLGTLAEDTAYVYNHISAFRVVFGLLAADDLGLERQQQLVNEARETLARAEKRAVPLIARLKTFSRQSYRPFGRWRKALE